MKTRYIPFVLSFLLISVVSTGCSSEPDMDQYGNALTLSQTTDITDILAAPDSYVGKKVRVEGVVYDVCPMKGCWMEIKDPLSEKMIKVKVEDDVIVFDQESKGKKAIAEGEVYEIKLDQEQAMSYLKHLADEKGEPFDSSAVDGPVVIYQLKGDGALVAP